MQIPTNPIQVGQAVRVRRQRWVVAAVHPYDHCQLVTLVGSEARNAGTERHVLVPFDSVEALPPASHPRVVTIHRWRRTFRALLADHGPVDRLKTAGAARMDLLPHQLEPALAVLKGRGSRVLLADEVGLGKTIQAGLLIAELLARGAAERVLILTPAGLRDQWASELADRFTLQSAIIDTDEARRRAATLPPGLNPWATAPLAVSSLDYVKRPEVLPAVTSARWDVVLVDEAHGVTQGTDRFRAVQDICRLASYVVLLTATPHNGNHDEFHALCSLGGHAHAKGEAPADRVLVFRRRRNEIAFAVKRRVHRVTLEPSAPELRMHGLLDRFASAVRRERGVDEQDSWLALMVLHKRALSSAQSLALTVTKRLAALGDESSADAAQLALPLDDPDGELDGSDEAPLLTTRRLLDDQDQERKLLLDLAEAAWAAAKRETKILTLGRLLDRLHKRQEPAIVFTEYRDTLIHLARHLPFTCAHIHGGLTRHERRAALSGFVRGEQPVLLATDAAGEGLNLQASCRTVINLELPWNPGRLEQRIGRVDRIGQSRTVHVFHLIARRTGEMRMLERLRHRVAQARSEFDAADPLDAADQRPGELSSVAEDHHSDRHEVVHLRAEALEETGRLLRARRTLRQGDSGAATNVLSRGALIAISRKRAVRLRLHGRVLVLLQAMCEDGCGNPIASHLIPVTLFLTPADCGSLKSVVEGMSMADWGGVANEPSVAGWDRHNRATHHTFWATRLAREAAIAMILAPSPSALQPGLFDRRAERARAADVNRAGELREALERRVASGRSLATLAPMRLRPVLVLFGAGVPRCP